MPSKTKKSHQLIGKLSELLISSGNKAGLFDVGTSPKSPLDFKNMIQSPRGLKNYDVGKVGLGIVAELDKPSTEFTNKAHEVFGSNCGECPTVSVPYLRCGSRSDPIPVNFGKRSSVYEEETEEMDSMENYTYVTSRIGPNKSFTKVFYDGGELQRLPRFDKKFNGESKDIADVDCDSVCPTSDFLSFCHLCNKNLLGKDIYMYRGEHAFCSVECRSIHMMKEVRQEQCRSEVPRTADVSNSSYTRSPIFSNGIFVI